jgi:hypothetical protein
MAEKVGFDAFYLQNTAVEKFHPHYFVGEILDFGLFQQSPLGRSGLNSYNHIRKTASISTPDTGRWF